MSHSIHQLIRDHEHTYTVYELDLIDTLTDINVITPTRMNPQFRAILQSYPEIVSEIEMMTPLIDSDILGRIMLILQGFESHPTCRTCGRSTSFNPRTKRWDVHCNAACGTRDPATQQRINETNKKRRGVSRALCDRTVGDRVRSALKPVLVDRLESLDSD